MNKKLYFLDEDEKDRILNLHESRTKKQYLISEDKKTSFKPFEKVQTTFDTITKQVEEAPKGLLNKTELDEFKKIKPQFDMAKPISVACKTLKNLDYRIVDTPEQIDQIVTEVYDIFEDSNHTLYLSTNVALKMGNVLNKFKSVPDLCYGIKISSDVIPSQTTSTQFPTYYVNDNFLKLFWDIFNEYGMVGGPSSTDVNTVKKAIYEPLKKIIKASEVGQVKTKSPEEETKEPENWKSYPCVTKSTNVVATRLKNGSLGYKGGGFLWYSNGRKQNLQNGEMSNYHCGEDGKVKEGLKSEVSNKQFANVEPVSGIGVVIPSAQTEIPTLMKMAGMEGQPINQDTINKLYDILSKK